MGSKDKENFLEGKELENNTDIEIGEDASKYGEWIVSYFDWVTPKEQKVRAKELDEMTKKSKENKQKL